LPRATIAAPRGVCGKMPVAVATAASRKRVLYMDRTDELRNRLEAIDARHDERMRESFFMLGKGFAALGKRRPTRWFLEHVLSRIAAWYVVERLHKDNEKARSGDPLDVAEAWLEMPILFRLPYRVAEASDERAVIAWDTCPLGFTEGLLATCKASTSIDVRTVERMGARLEVTENMLEGAPACLFVISRQERLRGGPGN
jgi:hypothetical protein